MPNPGERKYIYLGDRNTHPEWRNAVCHAVLTMGGKCIRGKNGNMLVQFGERRVVVMARLLRKRNDQDNSSSTKTK